MSDLIRREDVIKLVNQFVFGLCKEQNDEARKTFNKYIEKMPTVYSVDKVVEELEELKMRYFLTIANTGDEKSDFAYEHVGNALDKAIEIVKQGGVSDDVCECRLLKSHQFLHETSCGDVFDMQNGFKYCPYCGKKIKVVE